MAIFDKPAPAVLFHSTEFLFGFLPLTWLGFWAVTKWGSARAACAWLATASLVFYAWWNPPYVVLMLSSIGVNFGIGRAVRPRPVGDGKRWRAGVLWLGLALNVGALGYFKYANFFVENLGGILGASLTFERVILPLAISFFTFQQVAYLVDSYRGQTPRYGFFEYAFFVSFFPQLIAGPIVQHHEVLPQIEGERWRPVRIENWQVGITIFVIGLFKKMVLADGCAEYANPLFNHAAEGNALGFAGAWVAALAYSFQLYFDFSGYSDMAIGLARTFGIVLPVNFCAPYRATSVIEFWRCWHVTLSRFLRDYLYFPLGGNRGGVFLRSRNLLVTMLLGGLWHGAGWTFVVWGAMHGIYLVINHGLRRLGLRVSRVRVLGWAVTMLAVVVGWVVFRADSLGTAGRILASMAGGLPTDEAGEAQLRSVFDGVGAWSWFLLVTAIALIAPTTQSYLRNFVPALNVGASGSARWLPAWRPTAVHGLFVGGLVFVIFRRYFTLAPTEFLYFNF
ncbi:MAG: MBOAT family O-acyltransferase [Chthoniobacterales bacterium]